MRKGPAPSALMALLVWGSLVPRAGHGQHQASACVFALARGGEQIQATGAVVSNVRRGTQESTNNPFPFKGDVAFTLGSRGATEAANKRSSDVMTSPQLQAAIAGQIFEACSEVVTVRFNFTGTDWQTMLFRGANGRVIRGTCVDAMRGSDWPLWGYYRCV